MDKKNILAKILKAAKEDEKKRIDPRYIHTLGFLVAKGFLKTNQPIDLKPNKKLFIDDVIWAGEQVEPRILEVLPAAILRLPNHFYGDFEKHKDLTLVLEALKRDENKQGPSFLNVPFNKLKMWINFELPDRRTKTLADKRKTKTFRFNNISLMHLKQLKAKLKCTETEVIERLLERETKNTQSLITL